MSVFAYFIASEATVRAAATNFLLSPPSGSLRTVDSVMCASIQSPGVPVSAPLARSFILAFIKLCCAQGKPKDSFHTRLVAEQFQAQSGKRAS
jgi:hypothetical protein